MTRDDLLKRICPRDRIFDCCNEYTDEYCDGCKRIMNKWLYEYDKQIRAKAINDYNNELIEKIDTDTRLNDAIKKILDNIANEMYCKGIDDFVERLTTYLGIENATKYGNKNAEQMRNSYGTFMNYEIAESIEDVAEQLKAGVKNEN